MLLSWLATTMPCRAFVQLTVAYNPVVPAIALAAPENVSAASFLNPIQHKQF